MAPLMPSFGALVSSHNAASDGLQGNKKWQTASDMICTVSFFLIRMTKYIPPKGGKKLKQRENHVLF